MGLPGAYAGARIHPFDRGGPLQRRLHDQLGLQRVPGDFGPHLRPAVRAGLPPRPRRERAGGDLPAQARRRRLQGRHQRPPAQGAQDQERQAHRARGRRPSLARGGAGLGPDGLPMRRVRPGSEIRRHDAHANSEIPSAGKRHRRGMQLHPRYRHRVRRLKAHRQPEGAARGKFRRRLRRLRRAARPRSRHSRPQGSGQEHPYRHRLAVQRLVRPHRLRSASASSCSAAATPRWIAAAPRAGSAARTSR